MDVLQSAHRASSVMLLRATLSSRSAALAIAGSRLRRLRLRSSTCGAEGGSSSGELGQDQRGRTDGSYLHVGQKIAVNVLHAREGVVRQVQRVEPI